MLDMNVMNVSECSSFFLVLMLLSLDTASVTVTNHIENYEKTRRRPEANKKGTKANKWNLSFGDYY